ncbi:hypothetical protein [Stieleria varia]|uniref:Uncharacterized protein n=1 Tax=Stieleria varia TaxID=2528005 RepID=A0A5C6A4V2_9BACT|nr:hypothetical protein [Stieleria varia]TWT94400.1 hypothetical protein Pla52n_52210 [Stieleria varia]
MKTQWLATLLVTTALFAGQCVAQDLDSSDPFATPGDDAAAATFEQSQPAGSGIFGPAETRVSNSSVITSKPTVSELRQARAMYESQQRMARLERNRWMGYDPHRPNWASVHMMQSRYSRPTVYIPVYVW